MLSQTGEYALRAVVRLAREDRDEPLKIDEIASELGIPRNYLAKILHGMSGAGLLTSTRGPNGGFRLAVRPERLTLARIVDPFDPTVVEPGCLLGQERCSDAHPCRAHARWTLIASTVAAFFRETTVADLLEGFEAFDPAKPGTTWPPPDVVERSPPGPRPSPARHPSDSRSRALA